MDATLLETDCPSDLDLRDLVLQMREEISQLQRTVSELRCDVGYWKRRHADACRRIEKLQAELAAANAEIRKLKGDLYGQKSEKQRSPDHSHRCDERGDELEDSPLKTKRKRGQQKDRPGPARRDYSHLPVREELVELPPDAQVCDCCGKPVVETDETEDSEQLEVEQVVYRRRTADPAQPAAVGLARFVAGPRHGDRRFAAYRAAAGADLCGLAAARRAVDLSSRGRNALAGFHGKTRENRL